MVRFPSSPDDSTKGARNPTKQSAPEEWNMEKEGLTLQLWLPHGRTQNKDILLLESLLEASVTLQQATTILQCFQGVVKRTESKQPETVHYL